MSWAIDQAWASNFASGTGTTLPFTYAGAVSSGALLVAFISYENAVTVSGVADDVNGAWTHPSGTGIPSDAVGGSAGKHEDVWVFYNSASGTPTVTATFSGTAQVRTMVCGSYTGIATTSAYDVGIGNAQEDPGTGADAVTTGATGATAQANDLAIAAMTTGVGVTITSATGWTQRLNGDIGSNFAMAVQDKNIASVSAVTATWTVNNASVDPFSIVVTFKQLAAGAADVWCSYSL